MYKCSLKFRYDLLQNLKRAKVENCLESRLKYYQYILLIINEIGYLPINRANSKIVLSIN